MLLFANIFGIEQWMLVLIIVVLLFGSSRLPTLMRSLGQSVTEFKKGMEGIPEDDAKKTEPKQIDDHAVKS
jgi:sec-independent protein translocase protein TatA